MVVVSVFTNASGDAVTEDDLSPCPLESGGETLRNSCREILLGALLDMPAYLGILSFQIILEFVNGHDAGLEDTPLLQNDVFLVEMSLLDHRSEMDTGLGDRNMGNQRR